MGYDAAPTKRTRLVLPDLSVVGPGDVPVSAGNNVSVTRQGGGLLVAAVAPAPLRAVPAFAPGAAVARVLQRMTVPSPVLTALDIMLGTAPVGVTGANCGNVRVLGTTSGGPVVVPLAAGVSEYHLGYADLTTPLAGEKPNGGTANSNPGGWAFGFKVSTNVTVFNMDAVFGGGAVGSLRMGIATGVDATKNVWTGINWVTDAAGHQCYADLDPNASQSGRLLFTPTTATGFLLTAGTQYFLVSARQQVPHSAYTRDDSARTVATGANGIELALAKTDLGNITLQGISYTVGSWASTGIGNPPAEYGAVLNGGAFGSFTYPTFNLYGAVLGTPLTGLVEIGQTITGAPPGTTGSDANIVAQV